MGLFQFAAAMGASLIWIPIVEIRAENDRPSQGGKAELNKVQVEIVEPKELYKPKPGEILKVVGRVRVPEGGSPPQVVITTITARNVSHGSIGLELSKEGESGRYGKSEDGTYGFEVRLPRPKKPGRYAIQTEGLIVGPAPPGTPAPTTRVSSQKVTIEVAGDAK